MRSKAAREARLAEASSVEYKTIWNGLAMCVSSNSKRDRRPAAPGPCSGNGAGRDHREEPTDRQTQTHVPLRNANEVPRDRTLHEGLSFPTPAPGTD